MQNPNLNLLVRTLFVFFVLAAETCFSTQLTASAKELLVTDMKVQAAAILSQRYASHLTPNLNCQPKSIIATALSKTSPHRKLTSTGTLTEPIHNTLSSSEPPYIWHLIPHTHNDAGWLVPFETYYIGKETPFQECVQCILDSLFDILSANPKRVIPYVEMSFFERWYTDQTPQRQERVKQFIRDKQLSFSNAGWVMNDEACVNYEDVIEQFIVGHRFVHETFGYVPKVGWAIDPFGHSSTHAYLLAQMGFNMAIFERISAEYIESMKRKGSMEFVWVPDENFPEWNIIGHHNFLKYGEVQFSHYCFPNICMGERDVDKAVSWLYDQISFYPTHQLMLQLGNDFTFSYGADTTYESIESFIDIVNNHLINTYNQKMQLSTPETFTDDWYTTYTNVLPFQGKSLSVKHHDFFPYSDLSSQNETSYWTGYFTSKPNLKREIRQSSWFLQTARKMLLGYYLSITNRTERREFVRRSNEHTLILERAVAINQHHDAITGTAKKNTVEDYLLMLSRGRDNVTSVLEEVSAYQLSKKFTGLKNSSVTKQFTCSDYASTIECEPLVQTLSPLSKRPLLVQVYNPGSINRQATLRIKIPHANVRVLRANRQDAEYEIVCAEDDYTNSPAQDCDLYIHDFFPSYEYSYFYLEKSDKSGDDDSSHLLKEETVIQGQEATIELPFGSHFTIQQDLKSYDYKFCNSKNICVEDTFSLDYKYYRSVIGGQPSGAYIMRLESSQKFNLTDRVSVSYFRGKYVTVIKVLRDSSEPDLDIRRTSKREVVTKLRLSNFDLTAGIEMETILNGVSIPLYENGKEVVMVIGSKTIDNRGLFKTDSNGLKFLSRASRHQPDPQEKEQHQEKEKEKAAGIESNYYPVTLGIWLEDQTANRSLIVLNDRAQGGSSQAPGEVELMIHRRLFLDDQRGLSESLDELASYKDYNSGHSVSAPLKVRCKHYYQVSNSGVESIMRQKQVEMDTAFLISYVEMSDDITSDILSTTLHPEEKTAEAMPSSVKASVRLYSDDEIIVRLVNLHDTRAVTVSLTDADGNIPLLASLSSGAKIKAKPDSIREMSLSTIISKEQALREKFDVREAGQVNRSALLISSFSSFSMRPLELLTFRISNLTLYRQNKKKEKDGEVNAKTEENDSGMHNERKMNNTISIDEEISHNRSNGKTESENKQSDHDVNNISHDNSEAPKNEANSHDKSPGGEWIEYVGIVVLVVLAVLVIVCAVCTIQRCNSRSEYQTQGNEMVDLASAVDASSENGDL